MKKNYLNSEKILNFVLACGSESYQKKFEYKIKMSLWDIVISFFSFLRQEKYKGIEVKHHETFLIFKLYIIKNCAVWS